jgi:RimJ/RimL family protein N-acetyltransferase
MKTIETERLILRGFNEDDFAAVHSYGGNAENLTFMMWGPNTEEQTREYLKRVASLKYPFAIALKDSGQLIGGCDLRSSDDSGELGWLIHIDYWNKGYGTEIGKALLKLGFEDLKLRRITASCNAENIGSYRVMEKIGMRREALFIDSRPPHKKSDREFNDSLVYAILRDEWEDRGMIEYYNASPFEFNGFIDLPDLTDGVIRLVCTSKSPGNPEKKWVPAYCFSICEGSEVAGDISLRIGYVDNLYYGGQIGYNVD